MLIDVHSLGDVQSALDNHESRLNALTTAAANQAAAIGVQFEPFPASSVGSSAAPNTQVVFGVTVGVLPGAVLTGIKFRNQTAAAGTLPTTVRFGIADVTGKMLAVSANAKALANWAVGANAIPFTAPYTVLPGTQALIACVVVDGAWGTTQPAMAYANGPSASNIADGSFAPPNFQWAGQTDLPAGWKLADAQHDFRPLEVSRLLLGRI